MPAEEFYTFREYMNNERNELSACEEDYIEMIYRLSIKKKGYVRVNDLSTALNVKPPSVTKMIKKLGDKGLIKYKKYGTVELEDSGEYIGKMLLSRHNSIESFLKLLKVSEGLLEETEKIEHTINSSTLVAIKDLVEFFNENQDIKDRFSIFKESVDNCSET